MLIKILLGMLMHDNDIAYHPNKAQNNQFKIKKLLQNLHIAFNE